MLRRRRAWDPFPIRRRDGYIYTVRDTGEVAKSEEGSPWSSPVDPSRHHATGMLNLSPPMFKPRPRRRRQIQTRSRPPLLEYLILPVFFCDLYIDVKSSSSQLLYEARLRPPMIFFHIFKTLRLLLIVRFSIVY